MIKSAAVWKKWSSCCACIPATIFLFIKTRPSNAVSSGVWGIHQIDKIANYVRFLQENPQEVDLLFRELLIGVTSFFRDPEAWEILKGKVLPALFSEQIKDQAIRAWVPACSSGEEAYSLAIIFKEALEQLKSSRHITLQIFATDLDQQAIDKAREGIFPANISADVSAERLSKFFVQVDRGYQVTKSIRDMIIFAPQNIIMDPPFTKLDLVSCRNLLIYLTPELQKKLLSIFQYSLNPGGFLFLGSAETTGSFTKLFSPLGEKSHIFRRLDPVLNADRMDFPSASVSHQGTPLKPTKSETNIQTMAEQLLLQTYSPAAVLTNDKGDIVYISGRTGKYLEPAAGKVNWNILAMAREGLRYELSAAFQKTLHQKESLTIKNVVVGTNGGTQVINVTIQPIQEPNKLAGMVMVIFDEVDALPEVENNR